MLRSFHIDCGRKYFSLEELKEIADKLEKNKFDTFELAVGNGGFRFLLDDMSVTTAFATYRSETVKKAINDGNKAFCDSRENYLTENEMIELISYSKNKNITILPLLNTPGHMDALVYAMDELGIKNARYKNSASTMDLDNEEAVAFTKALLKKYISWFAKQGSIYFNMGCDEYANDVLTSGFEALCKNGKYDKFIEYANDVSKNIKEAGMMPVMFNDGAYYNQTKPNVMLSKDIIISYWNIGWPGYTLAPASFVYNHGHKIINTNQNWYYVLGRRKTSKNTQFCNEDVFKELLATPKDLLPGNESVECIGNMICVWCDEPEVEYNLEEREIISKIIELY